MRGPTTRGSRRLVRHRTVREIESVNQHTLNHLCFDQSMLLERFFFLFFGKKGTSCSMWMGRPSDCRTRTRQGRRRWPEFRLKGDREMICIVPLRDARDRDTAGRARCMDPSGRAESPSPSRRPRRRDGYAAEAISDDRRGRSPPNTRVDPCGSSSRINLRSIAVFPRQGANADVLDCPACRAAPLSLGR